MHNKLATLNAVLKTAQLQLNCQGCPVGHVPNLFIAVIQDFTPAKRLFSGNQNTVNSNQTLTIMTFIMTQENFYPKKTLFNCFIDVIAEKWHRIYDTLCSHHPSVARSILVPSRMAPHSDGSQMSGTGHIYSIRY